MTDEAGLERCLTFINCQLQPRPGWSLPGEGLRRRAVTLSRQTGSGGHQIAGRLAELLQARSPQGSAPWTLFDRDLVEKVLAEHHLPGRLARFMPEDRISEVSDTMDELFGLHPPSWALVHKSAETILRLVELGHVIIIGRGAHIITARLDFVFHVRLVAPLERRVRFIQEQQHLSASKAREFVHREDLGRRRFLWKYFKQDIDNPLLYHMVLNTEMVSFEEAAEMIAEAVAPVRHVLPEHRG